MALGFPNTWPSVTAVGRRTAGAVQKASSGALGFPNTWPVVTATGSRTAGAVQRPDTINGSLTATLGACTLVGTGTFASPATGGSHGGGLPLETLERPQFVQPRKRVGPVVFHGKTTVYATASLVESSQATGIGRSASRADGVLIPRLSARSAGYSVSMAAGSMRIAARNELHIRKVSPLIAIG